MVIQWVDSHIDLSPSILDLLGLSAGRDFELGSPLWDERIKDRTTFLFARAYLGADGFHERGRFYMWQYISGATYSNNTFGFGDAVPHEKMASDREHAMRELSERSNIE